MTQLKLVPACKCDVPNVRYAWDRECKTCRGAVSEDCVAWHLRLDHKVRRRDVGGVSGGKSGAESLRFTRYR